MIEDKIAAAWFKHLGLKPVSGGIVEEFKMVIRSTLREHGEVWFRDEHGSFFRGPGTTKPSDRPVLVLEAGE